jgi:hypothetical protein
MIVTELKYPLGQCANITRFTRCVLLLISLIPTEDITLQVDEVYRVICAYRNVAS